jgi:hypothetical protein
MIPEKHPIDVNHWYNYKVIFISELFVLKESLKKSFKGKVRNCFPRMSTGKNYNKLLIFRALFYF